MNGIDISAWQGDNNINLANVPFDFCIVKATEGTSYKNRYFTAHCDAVLKKKKLLGAYHYANGGDPQKEADYFLAYCKKYIGKAILVLDWEAKNNPLFGNADLEWCLKWCSYVQSKTGVKPLIYVQKSAMEAIKKAGYGLWVAQYPTVNRQDTRNVRGMRERTTVSSDSTRVWANCQAMPEILISTRHISALQAGISWQAEEPCPYLRSRQPLRKISIRLPRKCLPVSGAMAKTERAGSPRRAMTMQRYRQQSTSWSRHHSSVLRRSSILWLMRS